jgi:elongation factor 2
MNGTPLEPGKVAEIVKGIRKRKGLSEEVCIF